MAIAEYVDAHKPLIYGGGVLVLVVAGYMLSKKSTTTTATGQTADLTGLTNGLVYVPTSTNFTTENQSGVFASNDPTLTSITTGATNSPTSTTTITKTDTGKPIIMPPVQKPPAKAPPPQPAPKPVASGGGLLGPGIRFYPNYKNGVAYYRGPKTGGQIIPVPLPATTTYQPGAGGRVWYQSPPGSAGKLLTSGA
jgi:hypothetical protein